MSYSVGTVSIAAGATTATGVGSSWIGNAKAGDIIIAWNATIIGVAAVASDPVSNTSLPLSNPWRWAALAAGASYIILHVGPGWHPTLETYERINLLLDLVEAHFGAGGTAHAIATTAVAGFMSNADKLQLNDHETRLDAIDALDLGTTNVANTSTTINFPIPAGPHTFEFFLSNITLNGNAYLWAQVNGIATASYHHAYMATSAAGAMQSLATNAQVHGRLTPIIFGHVNFGLSGKIILHPGGGYQANLTCMLNALDATGNNVIPIMSTTRVVSITTRITDITFGLSASSFRGGSFSLEGIR